jgi:cell division protein FtsB
MLLLDEKSPDSSSSSSEPQLTDSAAENLRLQDQLRAEADMHRLEEESAALRSEIAQLQSSNQSADEKMGRLRQVLQEIGRAQQELDKVARRPKSNA